MKCFGARSLLVTATILTALGVPSSAVAEPPGLASGMTSLSVRAMVPAKAPATLNARAVELNSGRVKIRLTSNARKVNVRYRTAGNAKRSVWRTFKHGRVAITLKAGSHSIKARTRATSKLSASSWVSITPSPANDGWQYYDHGVMQRPTRG